MSFITKILGGVVKAVIPTVGKQKDKMKAVDTLMSKRGNVTKIEVLAALFVKFCNLLVWVYMLYLVSHDKISMLDSIKLLIQ